VLKLACVVLLFDQIEILRTSVDILGPRRTSGHGEARMIGLARRIANSRLFQAFVIGVILVNAVLVGLETSEELVAQYHALFDVLNAVIIGVFVVELVIRLVAYLPRPLDFFRDGWNVFDFVIVAVSLLPAGGNFATVARLARLLRVLRLVSVFPELRLIVGTMLRSLSSMSSVILLLALVVYVYAVLGYHLFSGIDPAHWGDLGLSVRTLFEVLTLEGWLELQAAVIQPVPLAWLFFGSYVLLAVFIVVNLFIAVILNNLESVKAEHAAEALEGGHDAELLRRIEALRTELGDVEALLRRRGSPPA
jgi:voltage-gated sodium channel